MTSVDDVGSGAGVSVTTGVGDVDGVDGVDGAGVSVTVGTGVSVTVGVGVSVTVGVGVSVTVGAGVSAAVTLILTLPFLPFAEEAVIVTVPSRTPVIFPLLSTVAIDGSELDQLILRMVASEGMICAVARMISPTFITDLSAVTFTASTAMSGFSTVTVAVAFFPLPSFAFTVILATPAFLAVTLPLLFTDATAGLELLYVTALFAAFLGDTDTVTVVVAPTFRFILDLFKVIFATGAPTLILQDAFKDVPAIAAVIVALPFFLPLTTPLLFTEATDLLLELQVTFLFLAFLGVIVAFNLTVLPFFRVYVL